MNFIAAALLYHSSEEITFFFLKVLFDHFNLTEVFLPISSGHMKHCLIIDEIIRTTDDELYKSLQEKKLKPKYIYSDWIPCLFTSYMQINLLLVFFNYFFANGWNFLYAFIKTILKRYREDLMKKQDIIELAIYINSTIESEFTKSPPLFFCICRTLIMKNLMNDANQELITDDEINELLEKYEKHLLGE